MGQRYSNTIVGAIVAVIGLAIVGLFVLPDTPTAKGLFGGLIVVVINTLLSVRQQEANGHRLTTVETTTAQTARAVTATNARQDATDEVTGTRTDIPAFDPKTGKRKAPGA